MSSYTLTNTAWGELYSSTEGNAQIVRATCKVCGNKTEFVLGPDGNQFLVRPIHMEGCRFAGEVVVPVAKEVPPSITVESTPDPPPSETPAPTPWMAWAIRAGIAATAGGLGAWFF